MRKDNGNRKISGILARRRRHSAWRKVVRVLCCVVVFCTTYALILPAITLEKTALCGQEEHTHTDSCYTQVTVRERSVLSCTKESLQIHQHDESCYDEQKNLVCGYADFVVHEHDGRCYDENGTLVCPLDEIEAHTHDESCYTVPEAHVHGEGCYTKERADQICTKSTEAAHTHTDSCYAPEKKLTCTLTEGHRHGADCFDENGALTCTQPEDHQHGESCYEAVLTCTESTEPAHVHTDDCYTWNEILTCNQSTNPKEPVLTCEKPEIILHEHTQECYNTDEDGNAYLDCDRTVILEHVHTDACFQTVEESVDTKTLTCGRTEGEGAHIHSAENGCYDAEGNLTCEIKESPAGHRHTPRCCGTWELTCEREEHTHSLSCYSDLRADVETEEVWKKTLPQELTGDWRQDLTAVAQSQLGYAESEKNYTVDERENTHGYTRYGAWYGDPYADWNSLFVLFCMNYGGLPADAAPQGADCAAWIGPLGDGYRATGSGYVPQAGDLAFFDADGNGTADSVGIVTKVTQEPAGTDPANTGVAGVTVVQGDDGNAVTAQEYSADAVLGYAVLLENKTDDRITRTYEGDDYTVTVVYGPEAQIPENAVLSVSEYPKDSEYYLARYAEASQLYGWEEDKTDCVRLFDVGFYVDGQEIQPAAPVEITLSYNGKVEGKDYEILREDQAAQPQSAGEQTPTPDALSMDNGAAPALQLLSLTDEENADAQEEKTQNGTPNVSQEKGFSWARESKIMVLALPAGGINPVTEGITLNMYTCTFDGVYSATDNKQHYKPDAGAQIDIPGYDPDDADKEYAYTYQQNGKTYYLIPVSYFDNAFGSAGFDSGEIGEKSACPFQYGRDRQEVQDKVVRNWDWDNHPLSLATYENYNGKWYVQLQNVNGENWKNIYYAKLTVATDTLSPSNAVINLFDYWTETRDAVDVDRDYVTNNYGINAGHPLKFFWNGDDKNTGELNFNTTDQGVMQGIVANTLGGGGYPHLSGNRQETSAGAPANPNTESLAYLFDPNYTGPETSYRAAYTNVKGLLSDHNGYFWYDASQRGVEYDESTNSFIEYTTPTVVAGGGSPFGQFFPFEDAHQAAMQSSRDVNLRHYYGMTLATRFVQRYGGHTNANRDQETTFHFSGDDDVWIFIDGALVADLGGTHSANSVDINFADGTVTIEGVYPGKVTTTTNIYDHFVDAGKESATQWREITPGSGTYTFADNTTHTLNFYYMERGNWDSTLSLEYNLSEVPPTAIYKVNQYGNPVQGAKFTVYKEDGTEVYHGTTDSNGEMVFADPTGAPYSISDLKEIFGERFTLKETYVPDGYRLVADEIHLRIYNNALVCDNTYDSGVWATPTLLVTAPNTLKAINPDNGDVTYYTPGNDPQGTLFAVPLKYTGGVNEDGTVDPANLAIQGNWAPVYGNPKDGYMLVRPADTSGAAFVEAAIQAAKQHGNQNVFKPSAIGAMQATLENLPGKVINYYHMLEADHKNQTQYTVAYYWSSANSLDGANSGNTFRVNGEDATNSFYREFGANIEVPNLSNRLLVQKYDEQGNLTNGATFALFKANENGTYIADNGSPVTLQEGKYEIQVEHSDGTIGQTATTVITTNDGKKITSYEQRTTNNQVLEGSEGTCVFGIWGKNLTNGCYYLREVQAPDGYKLNPTPIMIRVTNYAIYANAGTAGDGVTVARGPGYIVSPLHKAASEGDVDKTLTWIYQQLRVSSESKSFTEVPVDAAPQWNFQGETSYLTYTRNALSLGAGRYLANYKPRNGSTLQLSTDVGWSYNEIYQDTAFGKDHRGSANYTDLSGKAVTNLFSRSVYVRVTDEKVSNLEITKTLDLSKMEGEDAREQEKSNKEFTFTVTLTRNDQPLSGSYKYTVYSLTKDADGKETGRAPVAGKENLDLSLDPEGKATITLKDGQAAVIEDLPADVYSIVEKNPGKDYTVGAYEKVPGKDDPEYHKGGTVTGNMYWQNGDNLSKVDYVNTYDPDAFYLDMTVQKVDSTSPTRTLSGAEFTLKNADGKYYSTGDVKWVTEETKLTTGADGKLLFAGIEEGTYTLTETKAPDGYLLPEKTIAIKVTINENVKEIEATYSGGAPLTVGEDGVTLTVPNSSGAELPETGGAGTTQYTMAGLLLMMCAACLLYGKTRKGKEDIASF